MRTLDEKLNRKNTRINLSKNKREGRQVFGISVYTT